MRIEIKTLPLRLYQLFNVIVSLSLFVVVYLISHHKDIGTLIQCWTEGGDFAILMGTAAFFSNLHPLWSYAIYIILVFLLTWIVTLFFPFLDDDEMQNENSIQSIEDASTVFFPNYLAYFFVALSANDKYAVLIVFLIMLVLSYKNNTMLYNPLLVLFGYKYYMIVNENKKRSLVITLRLLNPSPAEPVSFPELKRLNDNTFIEIKSKKK